MKKREVKVEKYLDEKNRELYYEINRKHKIILLKIDNHNDDKWFCTVKENEKEAIIEYTKDIDSTGPFTHELFHVYLIQKGFSNNPEIVSCLNDINQFIFCPFLIRHINNILAHEKFYDEFIELGYNASEFTDDFNNIVEVNDLKVKIDSEFDFNKLPNESLNFFISSFYTAKTRHSVEGKDNLLNLLTYLEEKDQELFGILDRSWNKWSNSNNLNNKELFEELFEETETWLNNRKHSKQKI